MAKIQQRLADPSAGVGAIKSAAVDNVNRRYMGANDKIAEQLAARGYSSSGKVPITATQVETSRLGDLSNLEGQFGQMILNREDNTLSLADRLLQSAYGRTTTGTDPGNSLGAGLISGGNALENLTSLMMLDRMLKDPLSSPVRR